MIVKWFLIHLKIPFFPLERLETRFQVDPSCVHSSVQHGFTFIKQSHPRSGSLSSFVREIFVDAKTNERSTLVRSSASGVWKVSILICACINPCIMGMVSQKFQIKVLTIAYSTVGRCLLQQPTSGLTHFMHKKMLMCSYLCLFA